MGIAQVAVRGFKNIWSHGDDEYERDEPDALESADSNDEVEARPSQKYASNGNYKPTYGGGSAGARRLHAPVALPLRAREKNIYTLKPKSQDEASIAADYLKTGSAVVLNLDDVDRMNAVRIIDFMSGVCYGLDNQGHAMKLGDSIFLFTPGDFEISSDETDYAENLEILFKDVPLPTKSSDSSHGHAPTPFADRPAIDRAAMDRAAMERPAVERRPWER